MDAFCTFLNRFQIQKGIDQAGHLTQYSLYTQHSQDECSAPPSLPGLIRKVIEISKTLEDFQQSLYESKRLGRQLSLVRKVKFLRIILLVRSKLLRKNRALGKVIGFTGFPGVGKSTLASSVTRKLSEDGYSVAVLLIDPTSLTTNGSLLGDRSKFDESGLISESVFIRSLSSGRQIEGIPRELPAFIEILRCKFDCVLVETIGSTQNQFKIAKYSPSLVWVLDATYYDEMHISKIGSLEAAEFVFLNKSDRLSPNENKSVQASWQTYLGLIQKIHGSAPKLIIGSAQLYTGVQELIDAIESKILCARHREKR